MTSVQPMSRLLMAYGAVLTVIGAGTVAITGLTHWTALIPGILGLTGSAGSTTWRAISTVSRKCAAGSRLPPTPMSSASGSGFCAPRSQDRKAIRCKLLSHPRPRRVSKLWSRCQAAVSLPGLRPAPPQLSHRLARRLRQSDEVSFSPRPVAFPPAPPWREDAPSPGR